MDKQKCANCGHPLDKKGKLTVIGMHIKWDEGCQHGAPRHIAGTYNICFSCMLEAFGVKPNR